MSVSIFGFQQGDSVRAIGNDGVEICGEIDEIAPHLGLFWIRKSRSRARRIVELEDLSSLRPVEAAAE